MRWGPDLAVRYLLRPAPDTAPAPPVPKGDPNYLSTEAGRRLADGPVRFELCIQRYRDERIDPDRGHRCRVEGERVPSRAGGRPDAAPGRHHHRRRAGAGADHRRHGVQPVEHHRRVPSARQPEPRAQGGVRRQRRAPAGQPVGVARAAAQPGDRGRSAPRLPRREPLRRVAPAPGAPRAAQPGRVPPRAAAAEPHRHRAAGRTTQPATGAAGRAGGGDAPVPDVRRQLQRPLRPGHGCCRCSLRAQHPTGLPGGPVRPAEPDRGQPAAALPGALHPGAHAEPAGRLVDPVPGARLGEPCAPPARQGRHQDPGARGHEVVEHPWRPT